MSVKFYQEQLQLATTAIENSVKTFRFWMLLRLFIFLSMSVGIYFTWGDWKMSSVILIVGVIVFVSAISKFQDAKTALAKARKWKELLHFELLALEGNYSNFQNGEEFKDATHPFAHDMDLFGVNSIFQFLNRTFSIKGRYYLASLLKNGANDTVYTQEMITGLSEQIAWCMQFRVNGATNDWSESVDSNLEKLKDFTFSNPSWVVFVSYLLTFTGVGAFLALTLGWIGGTAFSLVLLLNLLVVGYFLKDTNRAVYIIGAQESKVKFLMDQMQLIQQLQTDNRALNDFTKSFDKESGALSALKNLLKIQRRLEMRTNVLVGALLNGILVWDLHQRVGLKKWMQASQQKISNWENDLVKLEAYISGAFIRYNYPETIFAEFIEEDVIEVKELRHPLLSKEKAVTNSVLFDSSHRLMILTGPNMAGKSTYLRSVGLLFVFANAGFPVFAKVAKTPRYSLYSSMRTSDDLTHESSYFHAELSRLKFILDAMHGGRKLFILLDEILKGTNSLDKEQGSKQFLQKLKRLNTQGIIATHDLALCELSKESTYFFNGYFDSTIANDELHFDYLWREGVCKNMNASFLLKKMNLID